MVSVKLSSDTCGRVEDRDKMVKPPIIVIKIECDLF